jgi:hypothetical protein
MSTCPQCGAEFAGKNSARLPVKRQQPTIGAKALVGHAGARPRNLRWLRRHPKTSRRKKPLLKLCPATSTDADARVWHHVQIAKCSSTKWTVTYGGRELGQWRDPEHCAARAMLDAGLAQRGDWLKTFHGSAPAMRGNVGSLADRAVSEPDRGRIRIVKWRPFEMADDFAQAA